MGRKKRHKLLPQCFFCLFLTIFAIYGFKGEILKRTNEASFTRRELLTLMTLPSPIPAPSIQPLPGDLDISPSQVLAPAVSAVPPSVHVVAPSVPTKPDEILSPSNEISPAFHANPPQTIVAPPVAIRAPTTPVPTVIVTTPSEAPISPPLVHNPVTPIPVTSPVSANTGRVPVSSPAASNSSNNLSPVNVSQPKGHAFSPTSLAPPPIQQNSQPKAPSIYPKLVPASPPIIDFSVSPPPRELSTHLLTPNHSHAQVPFASPPKETPITHLSPTPRERHAVSPASTTTSGTPVASPPEQTFIHVSPANNHSTNSSGPGVPVSAPPQNHPHSRGQHRLTPGSSPSGTAPTPVPVPPVQVPAPVPGAVPFHHWKGKGRPAPPPTHSSLVPSLAPDVLPKNRNRHHSPPPFAHGPSISPAPSQSAHGEKGGPSPTPSHIFPSARHKRPISAPTPAPFSPASETVPTLPPPPPNLYCTPLTCSDPMTNSLPGSPCICVLPIKVGLRLSVTLYKFFTLVSELAQEIASGVQMKQSQVRVMGANAATEDPDKTVVLVDLVPLGQAFDNITALLVYEKFWHTQVYINASYFGDYNVLYVVYPGLPPSPPAAPGNENRQNTAGSQHPFAADVRKRHRKQNGNIIVIAVLSTVFTLILCAGAAWCVILRLRARASLPAKTTPLATTSGPTYVGSKLSSVSASFNSSMATYKGSAKSFSLSEMERATNRFDESRVIGEGGFGRVYEGVLPSGKQVAVKVLKREDQQGSREFMAEVEMLSRLHHRNLVRLIGICTKGHLHCLVYELVPNGSVESHLYGADKEIAPLDWDARLKIALGAARALAYLHEDSSPRVIHRDFKSSNILLEHDFTPKVSDFGLARAALGEGNEHISTRVMGTFGYVAPEYAMTGHLLVKSDVYSYGVVLLELLTGRKPVDMLRPPGQENLVTWARPLLTNKDGLASIVDPTLGSAVPFDSLVKVAAIASMCVQPEVDQRPFMGEVVQALKLVCNNNNNNNHNDNDDNNINSKELSDTNTQGTEVRTSTSLDLEADQVLSASDLFGGTDSTRFGESGSFRKYSGSGPLQSGRGGARLWERGSSSEHGRVSRFGLDLEGSESYL